MQIQGSCNCQRVSFCCDADGPVPYQRCYCTNCRKTGSGGFMINLLARASSLEVTGTQHVRIHQAVMTPDDGSPPRPSRHQRHFCGQCGAHLWAQHPAWPELLHPVASSIDTALPVAPSVTHIFVRSKPTWVPLDAGPNDKVFATYPDESLEVWHRRHGLYGG